MPVTSASLGVGTFLSRPEQELGTLPVGSFPLRHESVISRVVGGEIEDGMNHNAEITKDQIPHRRVAAGGAGGAVGDRHQIPVAARL